MQESKLHKPIGKTLYYIRGDGQNLLVTFSGSGLSGEFLTGASIEFKIAPAVGTTAVISKSSSNPAQISIDAPNNRCTIYFEPSDTSSKDADTYVYSLVVTLAGGKPITVALNHFILCDTIQAAA